MVLPRRQFLQLTFSALAGAACVFSVAAFALDYPARPVRIVEGFGAGGTPDLTPA